jgi:hypothetical protein
MRAYAWMMGRRWRLQMMRRLAKLSQPFLFMLGKSRQQRVPKLAEKTFAELWNDAISHR